MRNGSIRRKHINIRKLRILYGLHEETNSLRRLEMQLVQGGTRSLIEDPIVNIDYLNVLGWEQKSGFTLFWDDMKTTCRLIRFKYSSMSGQTLYLGYTRYNQRLSDRFGEYTHSNYKFIYSAENETIAYDEDDGFDVDYKEVPIIEKMARKLYKIAFNDNDEIEENSEEFKKLLSTYNQDDIQKDIRKCNIKLLKSYEDYEKQSLEPLVGYKLWALHEKLSIRQLTSEDKPFIMNVVVYNTKNREINNIVKSIKDNVKINYGLMFRRLNDGTIIGVHVIKGDSNKRYLVEAEYEASGSKVLQIGNIKNLKIYENLRDIPKEYINSTFRLICACGGWFNSGTYRFDFKQVDRVTQSISKSSSLSDIIYETGYYYNSLTDN